MSNPETMTGNDARIIYDQLKDLDREIARKNAILDEMKAERLNYVTEAEYEEVNNKLIEAEAAIIRKDNEIAREKAKKADYDKAVDAVKGFAKQALARYEKHTDHFDYGERAESINNANSFILLCSIWQRYEMQAFEAEEEARRQAYEETQQQ